MKRLTILHPFLFGLFPIVSLYSSNANQVSAADAAVPTAVTMAGAGALVLLASLATRDRVTARVLTSVILMLFFSTGRFLDLAGVSGTLGALAMLVLWGAFLGLAVNVVAKWRARLIRMESSIAIVGVVLVALPIATAVPVLAQQRDVSLSTPINAATLPETQDKPSIYYIILDGYARADVLRDSYQYDNSEFLEWLSSKGFYVAGRSRANYCQTHLSLASSLNSTYLKELADQVGTKSATRHPLREMISNSRVVRALREQGYECIALSSGYLDHELVAADVFMSGPWSPGYFVSELLNTTPLAAFRHVQYDWHRERVAFVFEHLADQARQDHPIFVFAHVLAPHHPFVFDEDGREVVPERKFSLADDLFFQRNPDKKREYVEGYVRQLKFTNKAIAAAIDRIIAESPRPPIIVLQSDHGPGLDWNNPDTDKFRERMSILNAYYVPDDWHRHLYDEVTPVNTFRILFNQCFGADYELLKDESYFSVWNHPYEFITVTDRM